MAAGTFPPTVPGPMTSLSLDVQTTLKAYRSETGRVRRFGHTGRMLFRGTFTWNFTPTEYAEFIAWWLDDQISGTLPFTIVLTTGALPGDHTAQFVGLPKVSRREYGYDVAVPTVVLTRPSGVAGAWAPAFSGPPALFPYTEVGFPEMAFSRTPAQNFLATSGYPVATVAGRAIGQDYSLQWQLSPTEFDYFVEWYKTCLRFGQAKFIATFGELGTLLFTVVSDVSLSIEGMAFSASLDVQATTYDPSVHISYVYNRAEDYAGTADRWINKAEDVSPDRIINQGQP